MQEDSEQRLKSLELSPLQLPPRSIDRQSPPESPTIPLSYSISSRRTSFSYVPSEDGLLADFKKNSTENQLINCITALSEPIPNANAMKNFVKIAQAITSEDDIETLTNLLLKTRQKILIEELTETLEDYLEMTLKKVTNALIDSLHIYRPSKSDESLTTDPLSSLDTNLTNIKSKIHCNIIAISLLEKLLFPKKSLNYSNELTFKGFNFEEKKQLGVILAKIDAQFELDEWLSNWNQNTSNLEVSIFATKRSKKIKLDSPEAHNNKIKCCCY